MKKKLIGLLLGLATSVFAQVELPTCAAVQKMMPINEGRLLTEAELAQIQKNSLANSVDSRVGVGFLYLCGIGVQQDVDRGLRELEFAAADSNPFAISTLYYAYNGSFGVSENQLLAQKWLQIGADRGLSEMQLALGLVYWEGIKQPRDLAAAERWMVNAASQGHLEAYEYLVQFYISREQYADALKWAEIGSTAGDAMSAYLVGYIYSKGLGVASDLNLALKWLTFAAEKQLTLAELRLGKMYSAGVFLELDYEKSIKWYRQAAARSVPDAQAALANAYERGLGVPVDLHQGYLWRKKSTAQKKSFSADVRIAPKHPLLRDLYACSGIGDAGTDILIANSLSWARQGAYEAQVDMAQHLASKKDVDQTLCWYMSAVDGGDMQATSQLGYAYLTGNGLPINPSLGIHFLRLAAEGNCLSAKTRLADAYLTGIGVGKSLIAAYALKFTSQWANDELDSLLENYHPVFEDDMSAVEISRAKRLIREMSVSGEYLTSLDRVTAQ